MPRVSRIGHRGAAGHAPGSTSAAIEQGIALGVEFVEVDLRRTGDGTLMVLHDETVSRTTNGMGRVDQLSLARTYASFLHDELRHVRAVDPEPSLTVLFGRLPRVPLSRAMAYGPSHVGLRHNTATRCLV